MTASSRMSPLFTDLYELKMAQAYLAEEMHAPATFSLFVRSLPPERNFLLAAGLDPLLDWLEDLRFSEEDIAFLDSLESFSQRYLDSLRDFRFEGDVWAMPEGTPFFAEEPLIEVVAPPAQAQLVETLVMNQVHSATVLASKAARIVLAAEGRAVVDFGARRIHGTDAGLKSARAYHIAGVAATSNVLAGRLYGVPLSGTMAHSYVQAHDDEMDAFRAFTREFPETILLVDTYDTLSGVRKVIALARELGEDFRVRGVRLDSGDLATLSFETRRLLDEAGLGSVEIFASGGLDDVSIRDLVRRGCPIDGFGVGTSMGVSADSPRLDMAYKLTAYAGSGRMKLSSGKRSLPGRKQVFREERGGRAVADRIARAEESRPGRPLLRRVLSGGRRLEETREGIGAARERARREIAALPESLRSLEPADPGYEVGLSPALRDHLDEVAERVRKQQI
ncbi:MAG: nicotinate phosphoribosyltransferase [bacterium]